MMSAGKSDPKPNAQCLEPCRAVRRSFAGLFATLLLGAALATSCSNPIVGSGSRLAWQPPAHSFPQTAVGSRTSFTFVLKNSGARDETVSAVRLSTTSSSAFSIESGGFTDPRMLRPGQELQVVVRYAPTTTAEASGTLQAVTGSTTVDAVLSNLPPAPRLQLEPPGVDFGTILQGQTAEREITLRNIGTAPLVISSIALSMTSHSDFGVDLAGNALPLTLDILRIAKIKVRYTPTSAGSPTGALEVASNDDQHPLQVVQLSTGSSSPRISPDKTELRFGAVEIGQTKALTVKVTNAGTAELIFTPSVTGSADFQVPTGERRVAPNASFDVVVTYVPSDSGADTGNLVLTHNDPSQGPLSVALFGGSEPSIRPSPLGVRFSNVAQGAPAVEQEVVITNVGYGALVLGTIAFGTGPGQSHPDYTLSNVPPSGTSLARGQSTSFKVIYTKTAPANPTAQVLIASNDPEPSQNPFPLYVGAVDGITDPPPSASIRCSNCSGTTLQGPLPLTVMVDGTTSSDPQGQALIYFWALTGIPASSQAVLQNDTAAQTTFIADVAGTYRVSLIVEDESGQRSPRVSTDIQVMQ